MCEEREEGRRSEHTAQTQPQNMQCLGYCALGPPTGPLTGVRPWSTAALRPAIHILRQSRGQATALPSTQLPHLPASLTSAEKPRPDPCPQTLGPPCCCQTFPPEVPSPVQEGDRGIPQQQVLNSRSTRNSADAEAIPGSGQNW